MFQNRKRYGSMRDISEIDIEQIVKFNKSFKTASGMEACATYALKAIESKGSFMKCFKTASGMEACATLVK